MWPLVGLSSATMRRSRVVLPAPDPPTTHVVSVRRHTMSMPLSTSCSPNALRTSRSTTMSLGAAGDRAPPGPSLGAAGDRALPGPSLGAAGDRAPPAPPPGAAAHRAPFCAEVGIRRELTSTIDAQ